MTPKKPIKIGKSKTSGTPKRKKHQGQGTGEGSKATQFGTPRGNKNACDPKVHAKFLIGNQYALKFDTPEKRQALCQEFCDYIATGKHPFGFWKCSVKTMKKYIRQYPQDFPAEQIQQSIRKGFDVWETLGMGWAAGRFKGSNPNGFIFLMKNKYPEFYRDKVEIEHSDNSKVHLAADDKVAYIKEKPKPIAIGGDKPDKVRDRTEELPDDRGDTGED